MSLVEKGAGEWEGSRLGLPTTEESEPPVEEEVAVEVEELVLELDTSKCILLRESALCLTPGGEGERGSLRLSFSLREGARWEAGVEVVVAS